MKGLRLCLLLHRRDTDILPTRYRNKKTPPEGGVFSGPKWDKALNPDGL